MGSRAGIAALLASIAACSGQQAASAPSPPPPSTIAWRVHAVVPPNVALGEWPQTRVANVHATRGEHPTLFGIGRIATDQPEAQIVQTPDHPMNDGHGEAIDVLEYPEGRDVTELDTLSGEHYTLPELFTGAKTHGSRYYDLAPGVLALQATPAGAVLRRYDHGVVTPTWTRTIAGGNLVRVTVAAWLANGDVIAALEREDDQDLVRLHLADGTSQPLATIPDGPVALAERAGTYAVVSRIEQSPCPNCPLVEVRELATGIVRSAFDLPATGPFWPFGADSDTSVGFDGRLVWMYRYSPARPRSDMPVLFPVATESHEDCAYEAYDSSRGGVRVRQLATATGEWARLSASCAVRGLIPTADGGAIAFSVVGDREVEIVKLTSPP